MRRHLITLFFLAFLTGVAGALEIREARWGFDGRVVPERFNILSFLVVNPGDEPFEGNLELIENKGLGQAVGAPLVQAVYLAPHSARQMQFQPYVPAPGKWKLSWGREGRQEFEPEDPVLGGPARVLLIDSESPIRVESRLRSFPEDLFPATVSATDGLDAVVLDHVPRWEPARRGAFLDWVRRGGTVHLLKNAQGVFPLFSAELAVLNEDGAGHTRIGAGLVLRHTAGRGEVDEAFLGAHGSPERAWRRGSSVNILSFDGDMLRNLAAMSRPHLAWWLVYVLGYGYLALIGPVHYFWSKKFNYRVSLGLFALTVAGFTVAFAWAGRRGAGETQRVHSLAIARSLGDGRYDVSQWSSVFVIRDGLYKLSHASPANLYSMGPRSPGESAGGRIHNGRDAFMALDLPRYSSRPFLHRAVLQGDPCKLAASDWTLEADGSLKTLVLSPGTGFPKGVVAVCVRERSRIHVMSFEKGLWRLGKAKTTGEFFEQVHMAEPQNFNNNNNDDEDTALDTGWMDRLMEVLMARELGGVERLSNFIPARALAPGQLEVFVYAPAPAAFEVLGEGFKAAATRVLYVQDLFKTDL